jgi:SAM-dependent methyltransferase
MSQNIYDDPAFFDEYIKLPRQVKGLDAAPEWPALRAMIPDLRGSSFLDLGCGFGWTCRWARENGAEEAHGFDLSQKMLSKAKEFPKDPAITYQQADLDGLKLPSSTFDVAFSSLALHYLRNLPELVSQVYQSLTPGGAFVFSVEHPIWTAPRNPDWILDSEGKNVWPLDRYLYEGPRTTNWMAEGVIKQHRTIATYITILLQAGFVLSAIDEWGPRPEQLEEFPDWVKTRDRPPFLLIKAVKPKS